jgi:lysozyme
MKTSEKGKQFIKNYEGLRLKAYTCEAGKISIGYGYTGNINGKPINKDTIITKEFADKLFMDSILSVEKAVNKLIKVPTLTQTQYDAIISFVYNVGAGQFSSSTLLKELNNKNFNDIPQNFLLWNHIDTNKTSEGLTKRRLKEAYLFFFGEYK